MSRELRPLAAQSAGQSGMCEGAAAGGGTDRPGQEGLGTLQRGVCFLSVWGRNEIKVFIGGRFREPRTQKYLS